MSLGKNFSSWKQQANKTYEESGMCAICRNAISLPFSFSFPRLINRFRNFRFGKRERCDAKTCNKYPDWLNLQIQQKKKKLLVLTTTVTRWMAIIGRQQSSTMPTNNEYTAPPSLGLFRHTLRINDGAITHRCVSSLICILTSICLRLVAAFFFWSFCLSRELRTHLCARVSWCN